MNSTTFIRMAIRTGRPLLLIAILVLSTMLPSFAEQPPSLYPKREMRAVWLTTLYGLDWPKARTAALQRQEIDRMLDSLRSAHFNTVFIQVRGRGDVIYKSKFEPVMLPFRAAMSQDKSYDPLAYVIQGCHDRGMECHAWMVTLKMANVSEFRHAPKDSYIKRYRAHTIRHNGEIYMDPASEHARRFLADLAEELASNYDIDGIHLDYIRYPERAEKLNDQRSYKRSKSNLSHSAWREENIHRTVSMIYDRVKSVKPHIQVSASPIGKYSNGVKNNGYVWTAKESVHQDPVAWKRSGKIDFVVPMMYFKGEDFFYHLKKWNREMDGKMVAGLASYKMLKSQGGWDYTDLKQQIDSCRAESGVGGICFFRAEQLFDNKYGLWNYLRQEAFTRPALLPLRSSNPAAPEAVPEITDFSLHGDTLVAEWSYAGKDSPTFNIYISMDGNDVRTETAEYLSRIGIKEKKLTIPLGNIPEDTLIQITVTAYTTEYAESAPAHSAVYYHRPKEQQ
ncbi:glycoside hydrolase family 10 protein [Porphyromonas sp. COT-108 OH1349]|uniref:glycoside hydrolase family 10 protein n=1 Tax=Porphyromonas sp. COT-108 OH1349 TaxID=1537504 RepID=UPI00068B2D72|nr:family 10 glycosylhydrolase [Porphyromonas sp. COT-108 OH1349]